MSQMNKDDFIQKNKLIDGCIILEPWDIFSKAIVNVIDNRHIVYDYDKLVESIADSYRDEHNDGEEYDVYEQAMDWVDYNTIRTISFLSRSFRPYISQDGRIIVK